MNVDQPVEVWLMHYSMDHNLRIKKCLEIGWNIYTQHGKSGSLLDNIGRARVRIWQVNGISGAIPTDPCWSKTRRRAWREVLQEWATTGAESS